MSRGGKEREPQGDAGYGADAPEPAAERGVLRVLIASAMLSKVADWQLSLVVPLAILATTGSMALSLISIALRGIAYIASPFVGSLIDRFDTRIVFIVSQGQQALCLALVAAVLDYQAGVALLLLLSGIGGVASTISGQFVLIPKLLRPERRPTAIAKLNSAIEFSKIIGLVLGGVAFAEFGPVVACLCIAALYAGAALASLPLPAAPAHPVRTRLTEDLATGFTWLVKPDIIWLVGTMALVNLAIGQLEPTLSTTFAQQGVDPKAISFVLATGLFMGAVASRFTTSILPSWSVQRRILVFQLVAFVALVLVASSVTGLRIAGYMAVCMAVATSNVVSITYRQDVIPVEIAGRVNATIRMLITGAVPLSGAIYAWASRFDGYLFWLPALSLWVVALLLWGSYTLHGELAARGRSSAVQADDRVPEKR